MATQENKTRSEATFQYTVDNFSKMEDSQVSPPFYVRNLPWKIMVKPCCNMTEERRKYLSVFLQCNRESISDPWRCYADAELRLLSHKEGQTPFSRKIQHVFQTAENDWGFHYFMTWQEVLEVERGYIKKNSITLEVHVLAENHEDRMHRILTETKQEMSRVEQSMNQRHQEVVEKIEKLEGDMDEREERRGAAFTSLSEQSKRDISRVESNMRQWKQEIVEKIEMLGADMSKETAKRKYLESIMRKDEKKEKKKRQKQLEVNKLKEIEERIENMQKTVQKKSMFITGLGILIFIILNVYILPGCEYH